MANRLTDSTSPYLLQHALNPVDWYPWGDEAFDRARREDKPVLVSIGYSACHWCHVMAHESFENETVARMMNDFFVSVKVDREERPDVDAVYMEAVQMMTGQGGWPLNVFLTPDRQPFFGGAYWPPSPRHGMNSWPEILRSIAVAWRDRRDQVVSSAGELVQHLTRAPQPNAGATRLDTNMLTQAYSGMAGQFDRQHGGFGGAPKFPQPLALESLLRFSQREKDSDALDMVVTTLNAMAAGGIYDHLGGGFHRYSVDERWLVPHFEKMLYDNALLSRLYTQAWQATGDERYRETSTEVLDYVLRDMTSPEGGFYSSEDADSEGEEGKFYVWSKDEVASTLNPSDTALFEKRFGITKEGNFEGTNILTLAMPADNLIDEGNPGINDAQVRLERSKQQLFQKRLLRVRPHRDEKILTDWNALMLRALASAGTAFARQDYLDAATRNASFLLEHVYRDGKLLHLYNPGNEGIPGFLEDYVFLIEALLVLFEATGDTSYVEVAVKLASRVLEDFNDPGSGFFTTSSGSVEELPSRPKSLIDGALPSGNSAAAMGLLRLAAVTGNDEYATKALECLALVSQAAMQHGASFGYALSAMDYYLSPAVEVVLVRPRENIGDRELAETLHRRYLPNALRVDVEPDHINHSRLPLLEGKVMINGRPTAYVCRNYACKTPVSDASGLIRQLSQL